MDITNLDLTKEQEKEVRLIIEEMKDSMNKNLDMILVLGDGTNVLLVKRDKKILFQNYDALNF